MAELKRTFSGGAMNKDLDERLLPNGKYRDALNVQVSTSEGADVGALQNILGNKLPYANSIVSNLGDFPKVIGSIRRDETECIYWFVVSNDKNLIIEFDQLKGEAKPIIVDTRRVLGFDRENLITGIEILDDFLIWTDNRSEPKMIKVSDWREYTNGLWTHTQVDGGDFEEKHCTVIKEGPKNAPSLRMSSTTRNGPISTRLNAPLTIPATGGYSFTFLDVDGRWQTAPTGEYTDQDGDGTADAASQILPNPADSQVEFSGTAPDFRVGDKLKVTLLDDKGQDAENDAEVILSVLETYATAPKVFKVNVDAVDVDIEQGIQNWKVELIQKPAMFETKFVRFAYRYKYKDGEYSTISPFSEVAFLGDEFNYDHRKGYNLGMVNQLRKLEIRNFAPSSITGVYVPYNVKEVDILYKDSVSSNIYVVKSIKTTDPEYTDVGSFLDPYSGKLEIESELVYKLIPSNQILRPYDNVPRRAKALSVSGNRLMFGNYTENYDMVSQGQDITVKFAVNVVSNSYPATIALPSIKSQRTYQVGVAYRDKYGRETPVFTDQTGSFTLNKGLAESRNSITARVTSPMPSWADSFKYYVKETSQPYYNVAMDRYYAAEDGNLWIAFSSSDRNKVNEETFLTLKKEHDSNNSVKDEAKYKVLAIENEAPDFIKNENVSKGVLSQSVLGGTKSIFKTAEGYPLSGNKFIDIRSDLWQSTYGGVGSSVSSGTPVHQLNDLNIVIFSDKNKTKNYEIASIQYFENFSLYRLNLEKVLDLEDVSWMAIYSENNPTVSIEIFQKITKAKPEFQGRFFAKLQRDVVLESHIIPKNIPNSELLVKSSQKIIQVGPNMLGLSRQEFWEKYKETEPVWEDVRDANGIKTGEKLVNKPTGDRGLGWFINRTQFAAQKFSKSASSLDDIYWDGKGVIKSDSSSTSGYSREVSPGHGVKSGWDIIEIAYQGWGEYDKGGYNETAYNRFADVNQGSAYRPEMNAIVGQIMRKGSKFRFSGAPKNSKNIYTIEKYCMHYHVAWGKGTEPSQRVIQFTLKLDKPIDWSPEDATPLPFVDTKSTPGYSFPRRFTNLEFVAEFEEETNEFTSDNPAVFETEPKEAAELDIYYEASRAYDKSSHGSAPKLAYQNCYSFGNGVESDRIRDDFNAPILGKGVKVSTVLEDQYKEVTKKSDIIYSGIYNSTSGINNLNQFIQAEQITKSINPSYGSIQLMQFRLGDLDVYLEDNIVKVLADKDALFNADGSRNVVASTNVLGSIQPYAGDYGISKNPESYSRYGNRAYFSDKNRGVILRLSGNGLIPISKYGMEDYFRDKLAVSNIKAIGSYDENKDEYNLTLSSGVGSKDNKGELVDASRYNDTVSFKEDVNGWNTRKSFIQESGLSLNNIYYTFNKGEIWSHDNEVRNNFYGEQYDSSVKFIFNDAPGSVKSFKTLNYEGSQARVFVDNPDTDNKFENRIAKSGWWVNEIKSDLQEGQVKTFKDKEGKWFYNILGTDNTFENLDTREYSVQGLGYASVVDTTPYDEEIEIIIQ